MKFLFFILNLFSSIILFAQTPWVNVDSNYLPLPTSVHIYFTQKAIDTGAFRAFYIIADLQNKDLEFDVDTAKNRRLTPDQFYKKNNEPLIVVNTTFFSFETNKSLNVVVKNNKTVAYPISTITLKGKDTFTYSHILSSAFGITKNKTPDVAWVYADSNHHKVYAIQNAIVMKNDSIKVPSFNYFKKQIKFQKQTKFKKWKMKIAIGGGPVLIQNNEIKISNNEEMKFANKAIYDKHPRTAIGYTQNKQLIILMIEGRNKNAGGATLMQEAIILKNLGCVEAINLDGGGSSCLLVNGKPTIQVSDKVGQRPVPAVFIISKSKRYNK